MLGFRGLCRAEKPWIACSISLSGSFHFSLSIWLVLSVLRAGLEFGVDDVSPKIFDKFCCFIGDFFWPSLSLFARCNSSPLLLKFRCAFPCFFSPVLSVESCFALLISWASLLLVVMGLASCHYYSKNLFQGPLLTSLF